MSLTRGESFMLIYSLLNPLYKQTALLLLLANLVPASLLQSMSYSTNILPLDALPTLTTCVHEELIEKFSDQEIAEDRKKPRHSAKHRPRKKKKPKRPRPKQRPKTIAQQPIKDWTVIVYLAADNDLNYFAWKNIKQMEKIGSNKHLNIVIQLSERGKHKPTQRYLINKNQHIRVPLGKKRLDSGSPNTLINFCDWAIKTFPAHNYALILWNHGTGALEPSRAKTINPSDLFIFNPSNNMLELDRTIGFLDFINSLEKYEQEHRGICFDESHRTYISNKKLDYALNKICQDSLQGKKFSLIGFDACLMSMIEIVNIIKKYAQIMVGSQEVELGSGWNYQKVLAPFLTYSPDKKEFARHIVTSYQQVYERITTDFTQSAVDLDNIPQLEANIHQVAELLLQSLLHQKDGAVKNVIKMCRSRRLCTCFDEPTYIDLCHFYINLLKNISYLKFKDPQKGELLSKSLQENLTAGIRLIPQLAFANSSGKNLAQAKGLSIYFPEYKLHSSYKQSTFAIENNWFRFLQQYIAM